MLYIANWKMNVITMNQALYLAHEISMLPKEIQKKIVVCPSFIHISTIANNIPTKTFSLGAQTCSEFSQGAFTGQVSAASLKDSGVSYCIVGHSEQRLYNQETSEKTALKVQQLLEQKIMPIICVGENEYEYKSGQTTSVLASQLAPTINFLKSLDNGLEKLYIAYEPVWAIGSGKTPENHVILDVFAYISNYIHQNLPRIKEIVLLYGGSVDETSAKIITILPGLGGFLIGGASTDFQKFKNIVLLK